MTKVVVLDSLFQSLDLEEQTAREAGATLARWDGDPGSLGDADVVAHVRTRLDSDLIAAMPRCRVISRFGSGIDTVDLRAAAAARIAVVSVRDYCVRELATHTLALAFSVARRVGETAGHLDVEWDEVVARKPIAGHRRATVIGLGSVGTAVAAALVALGYEVRAVTRHGAQQARELGAEPVGLDDGLASGEIVFLHTALDDSTSRMIDARRLKTMRSRAILVDTARLGLLDEHAVADALGERRLGGLALDAILPPTSPIRRFAGDPRVVVTPHIGWYSEASAGRLRRAGIADALAALSSLPTPATR